MLLREYQQLQFQHTDTIQQNKQLNSKCDDLQQQLDEEKSLSKRNKQRFLVNLDNTISEQTMAIQDTTAEKQTIRQQLDDEVMIRHQTEHLFEEETVELRNSLIQEISLRCQAKQEQETSQQ